MTLDQRNRFFIAGIALSALCILGALVQFGHFIAVYPELIAGAARRSPGFLQILAEMVFPPSAWASLVSVCAALFFALGASIANYFFFEKTHCPEILFLGLFAASFAFEILRFLIPLKQVYGFSGVFLGEGARILFFGRFFGVLSFFAAPATHFSLRNYRACEKTNRVLNRLNGLTVSALPPCSVCRSRLPRGPSSSR
jgi:hypothetical protein